MDALAAYAEIKSHAAEMQNVHMRDLFNTDPKRFEKYTLQAPHLFLDYSKNRITEKSLELLFKLAEESALSNKIKALFSGEKVNSTENRSALHTALRLPLEILEAKQTSMFSAKHPEICNDILACRKKMARLVSKIHENKLLGYSGEPIDTLVSIGIGGSFLGPKMVTEALKPYAKPSLNVHYIANIDGTDLASTLDQINPKTTLFLIQSKSFNTLETLENAREVRKWLESQGVGSSDIKHHFMAVTSNVPSALEFGILQENILPMWDWVGGRYSLWSAIGFPIAFILGMENFEALLKGAHDMDTHFLESPISENMPIILGLIGIWYHNFFDAHSYAILPYDQYLHFLPDHLQQLDMESSGKSISTHGEKLTYHSGPIIWGGEGSNGQHAYHQLLHQGTRIIPCDFIMPLKSHHKVANHHKYLFANCLSQSQALMQGKTLQEAIAELIESGTTKEKAESLAPHKVVEGNKPNNTILLDQLNPTSLGSLISLYEHKVFVQSTIWDINPFDQWGVELGKALGESLFDALDDNGKPINIDASTSGLLDLFKTS